MPNMKLYFSHAFLLLVFSCPLWQVSQSSPVQLTRKGAMTDSCVSYARSLLWNVTNALTQNNLFKGINCSEQSVELHMETGTADVCAAKGSMCSGVTSQFDQESCLTKIGEDLLHYNNALATQPDSEQLLRPTVLFSLRELMGNCFSLSPSKDSMEATPDRPSNYDERLHLCKVLKGFQVRAITINRAIAYIHSGEHNK